MMYICAWQARAVAAGALDLLEDRRGGRERQAGAAIFLRDQGRQIAGFGERLDEIGGIGGSRSSLRQYSPGKSAQSLRTSSRMSSKSCTSIVIA